MKRNMSSPLLVLKAIDERLATWGIEHITVKAARQWTYYVFRERAIQSQRLSPNLLHNTSFQRQIAILAYIQGESFKMWLLTLGLGVEHSSQKYVCRYVSSLNIWYLVDSQYKDLSKKHIWWRHITTTKVRQSASDLRYGWLRVLLLGQLVLVGLFVPGPCFGFFHA